MPKTRHGRFGAFLFVLVGVLLLLINLDYLTWDIWPELLRFWPVLLIVAGLQLLFGGRRASGAIIDLCAIAITLFLVIAVARGNSNTFDRWVENRAPWLPSIDFIKSAGKSVTETLRVKTSEYPDIAERDFSLKLGAMTAELEDDPKLVDHIALEASYLENYGKPELSINKQLDKLAISVKTEKQRGWWTSTTGKLNYKTTLGNPTIPTTIEVDLGAGKFVSRLESQKVRSFTLSVGAGEAELAFSSDSLPIEKLKVDIGAGSISLEIPSSVGLEIEREIGAGSFRLNGESIKGDGTYKSANYDTATVKLKVVASIGAGSLKIVTD